MNVVQLIDRLRASPEFGAQVTEWRTLPARPARYDDLLRSGLASPAASLRWPARGRYTVPAE